MSTRQFEWPDPNEDASTHWYFWLWNLARQKTVVNVKNNNIESKRMKREMHSHATSSGEE